jgi:hypothetical protein
MSRARTRVRARESHAEIPKRSGGNRSPSTSSTSSTLLEFEPWGGVIRHPARTPGPL